MLPATVRRYVIAGLESLPIVLDEMLREVDTEDSLWDFRPDPERFTVREILAHLADFEPIWRERIERTAAEERPFLASRDENQMAIDNDYEHQDPRASLERLRAGRGALVDVLRALPDSAWSRIAEHEQLKEVSLAAQAALVLGHDGYHTRQVAEWKDAARSR